MSAVLDKFKNVFSNTATGLNNFVSLIGDKQANILILICLIVLLSGCFYLLISYSMVNKKINDLTEYATSVRSLGKIYSNSEYDPVEFEKILLDSLESLRNNINIITIPYFYTKKIDDILKIYPDYIKIMKFAKYIYDHPDTKNDAIHKILLKKYGKNYKTSPQLEMDVSINLTEFQKSTSKHSILIDISRSQTIYKINISRVNELLK